MTIINNIIIINYQQQHNYNKTNDSITLMTVTLPITFETIRAIIFLRTNLLMRFSVDTSGTEQFWYVVERTTTVQLALNSLLLVASTVHLSSCQTILQMVMSDLGNKRQWQYNVMMHFSKCQYSSSALLGVWRCTQYKTHVDCARYGIR